MRKLKFALLAGAAFVLVVLITTVAIAASQSASTPPPPGQVHHYTTIPYSQQQHATNGPFIAKDVATHKALAVGDGHGKIVSAQFLTTDQATAQLGTPATSETIGADRQVWLVLVHGSYVPSFWNPTSKPPTYNHYFVVIDGTTGQVLSTGSPIKQTW